MLQTTLDFEYKEEYREEDYIISESNQLAFDVIDNFHNEWGVDPYPSILLLTGPEGSGKTHMSNLWKHKAKAVDLNVDNFNSIHTDHNAFIIDDIDLLGEYSKELFHIFNIANENNKYLLLTSSKNQAALEFDLQDLSSRIKSIRQISIQEADDQMIQIILFKHFSKRSLRIDMKIINYLSKILPRNFKEIEDQMSILDKESLRQKRSITIPFIKNIIQ
jgi:chromosomal replication initiation ATPase DnaA